MARFAVSPFLPFIFLFALSSVAQITNVTNTTSTPIPGAGHDEIKMLSETVNPANGSVAIRLNMPVPPGRLLSLPFVVGYDSNGFSVQTPYLTTQGTAAWKYNNDLFSAGGWSYSVPQLSRTTIQYAYPPSPIPICHGSTGYVFLDPAVDAMRSGYRVNLRASDCHAAIGRSRRLIQACLISIFLHGRINRAGSVLLSRDPYLFSRSIFPWQVLGHA